MNIFRCGAPPTEACALLTLGAAHHPVLTHACTAAPMLLLQAGWGYDTLAVHHSAAFENHRHKKL
jgi:hypothetical protein